MSRVALLVLLGCAGCFDLDALVGHADLSAATIDLARADDLQISLSPCSGPNLIANPGFEGGTATWTGFDADLTIVSQAHEGASALQVCHQTNGTMEWSAYTRPVTMPTSTTSYCASAWVLVSNEPALIKLSDTDTRTDALTQSYGAPATLGVAGWQLIVGHSTGAAPGTTGLVLDVYSGADTPATLCWVVDDVVLTIE
jgi:hypothetical protein